MTGRIVKTSLILALFLLPSASLGDSFRVRATGDNTWRPATREIHKGDKVVWRNPTDSPHNVTAYGSNWEKSTILPEGSSTSKRFRRRGTYKYVCTFHGDVENGRCEGMCGKIKVLR